MKNFLFAPYILKLLKTRLYSWLKMPYFSLWMVIATPRENIANMHFQCQFHIMFNSFTWAVLLESSMFFVLMYTSQLF